MAAAQTATFPGLVRVGTLIGGILLAWLAVPPASAVPLDPRGADRVDAARVPDCTITGTPGRDVLVGTDGDDVICGLGGDDRLLGRGGQDVLRGGSGNDVLRGGDGADVLRGEGGDDDVQGGSGADLLTGARGDDELRGGPGDDEVLGGLGADLVHGGDGDDDLHGGRGPDTMRALDGPGHRDDVTCGAGERDRAFADDVDRVSPNCEFNSQNAAPVAVDDSYVTDEDTRLDLPAAGVGGPAANDTDPDGDPLRVVAVSTAVGGSVALSGTTISFTPAGDNCGPAAGRFDYRVADEHGGSDVGRASVAITCTPDDPTAVDDAATVTEDSSGNVMDVLDNDVDPDGDPLTIASITAAPSHGVAMLSGNVLTYTPSANYCNTPPGTVRDTFAYALTPGGSTATVTVSVVCVDDVPSAVDDSATVAQDAAATAIDVLANDTDADGGPKTVASVTQPANGTVVITGGGTGLTYQPDTSYCNAPPGTTPDTFTYTLNAGSTATVSVTVSCPDEAPVAVGDSATVAEDSGASAIDVLANDTDADGGPKTVASVTQPANGTVVITGGGTGLTYAPNANYCNAPPGTTLDTFTYTLNGGSTATVTVTVTCGDDAPVAVGDSATVAEDSGASAIDVLANDTDLDGGPKTVASVTQPANGTVVITGGGTGLTYAPNANYCNAPPGTTLDTFTYTLNAGSTATVSVTVTCADDGPVVDTSAGTLAFTENDPATVIDPAVTVTDADAGATIVGGTVQVTGNYASGQDVLALTGTHSPITASYNAATGVLTLTGTASTAAYQAALRAVTYANSSEAPSTLARTVSFSVTDDTDEIGSDTRGVAVTAVDDLPIAVNDSATVPEDASAPAVAVLANDTDVDGGPKTIASATDPANGTVVITGGGTGLTYAPDANYCNDPPATTPDTFTYTLNGGSIATVSMTVTCVNDAPVADDETFTAADAAVGNTSLVVDDPTDGAPTLGTPKKSITGDILAGDVDVDGPGPLVVTAGTFATSDGGSVTVEADGDFIYTPAAGTSCTDTTDYFDYTISDQDPTDPQTDVGRVNLGISGCVWYVSNNAAGNSGTSTAPFDTLAQAEAASGTGDTIYLYDGDNTTTGYAAGIDLKANQRLIGEAATLSVGGFDLAAAVSGNRPTLTDSGADVVTLAAGNLVRGVQIDPAGVGGGIAGGAGDASGTIDDVRIIDAGTAGTQPALELNGTSGTFDVSDLTIDNTTATGTTSGSVGVLLNNAGTVNFASTGTISISVQSAKGLDATGTSLGTASVLDTVSVTGSGAGAVSMTTTTGTTTFGDLALTTTSGGTGAFVLANAGTVTVSASGTANVSATGGPAVDVTGTSGATLAFDAVSSTTSSTDGINLAGLGAGTFSATTGTLTGAAGIAFDLDGGTGAVTYPGAIGNGSGQTAEISGRSGGVVTLSGTITDSSDAGGGIVVSGNTAGSTVFSGAAKTLSTGTSDAVVMATSDGHTLTFSGGGLDVDTTTGKGLEATTSGTLVVSGTGNTIDTGAGRALNVTNTDIGAGNVTFERISANGAANGIVLNGTGTAGGLTVVGNGGSCATTADACTGGTIQATTGDALSLTTTRGVSLSRMKIVNNLGNGIRGDAVTNFGLTDSVVDNNADDAATDEAGLNFTNLGGTADIVRVLVAHSPEDNARVVNSSANLTQLNVTDSRFLDTDALSPGNNGLLLQADGGSITADVLGSTFLRNRANGLQVVTNGTGSMNVEVDDSAGTQSTFDDNNIGVNVAHNSSGAFSYAVRDLTIDGLGVAPGTGGSASPININLGASATSTMSGTVSGNTLTNSDSTTGPGIRVIGNGSATMTTLLDANTISQVANYGIQVLARDGSNTINATVTNNNVNLTHALSLEALRLDSGATTGPPADTTHVCADIRGNTATTIPGFAGIRVRQRFALPTFTLEGYAGGMTDDTAVANFLAGLNTSSPAPLADHLGAGFGTTGSCPTP